MGAITERDYNQLNKSLELLNKKLDQGFEKINEDIKSLNTRITKIETTNNNLWRFVAFIGTVAALLISYFSIK